MNASKEKFPPGKFVEGDLVKLRKPEDFRASFDDPAGVLRVSRVVYYKAWEPPVYVIAEEGGCGVIPFRDDDLILTTLPPAPDASALPADVEAGELCTFGPPAERKPHFILKFEDNDVGDMHFRDRDLAIATFKQHSYNWNCTLFETACLAAARPSKTAQEATIEKLEEEAERLKGENSALQRRDTLREEALQRWKDDCARHSAEAAVAKVAGNAAESALAATREKLAAAVRVMRQIAELEGIAPANAGRALFRVQSLARDFLASLEKPPGEGG